MWDEEESNLKIVDAKNFSSKSPFLVTEIKKVYQPKPATLPTFSRIHKADNVNLSNHEYRFEVTAPKVKNIKLPSNFSAIKEWAGMITGVFDQERCGSCWSFVAATVLTDRIRIKSKGKFLGNGDYLSPFHLAACMKCGIDGACPLVCEGNYLDDVFQNMVDHGVVAQSDIDKHSNQGGEYRCFDWKKYGVTAWKGTQKYRVNLYPPAMLTDPTTRAMNEQAIMEEIYNNGSIAAIFKIYVPMDDRNFYLHKSGVYGHGWKNEPKESDGYHHHDCWMGRRRN